MILRASQGENEGDSFFFEVTGDFFEKQRTSAPSLTLLDYRRQLYSTTITILTYLLDIYCISTTYLVLCSL